MTQQNEYIVIEVSPELDGWLRTQALLDGIDLSVWIARHLDEMREFMETDEHAGTAVTPVLWERLRPMLETMS